MDSKRNSEIVWYLQDLFMVAFTALHPMIICYVLLCDTLAVHPIFPWSTDVKDLGLWSSLC